MSDPGPPGVAVGAIVLIRPGEKIPLDGVVVKGESSVNQAQITGESLPAAKQPGDEVYAGTINQEGSLEFRTTRGPSDTTLARIIRMVESAQSRRARSQQWVERFSIYYTPGMMFLAISVALLLPLLMGASWSNGIFRGLVILVIACPCALVISTPVSIVSALTAAARNGILIKGGVYLEAAGRLEARGRRLFFPSAPRATAKQPNYLQTGRLMLKGDGNGSQDQTIATWK